MGTLVENFAKCLEKAGAEVVIPGGPFVPRADDAQGDADVGDLQAIEADPGLALPQRTSRKCQDEAWDMYVRLGGILPRADFKPQPGKWDLTVDGINTEFDEQLHFNRYRLITLSSSVYDRLTFDRDQYRKWCLGHEGDCLKASFGGKWTNPSCEKQFGPAGPLNVLVPATLSDVTEAGTPPPNGSPRWKQRALYDFCKDLWVLCTNGVMCRVSIWDEIDGRPLKDVLLGPCTPQLGAALLDLVRRRTFRRK